MANAAISAAQALMAIGDRAGAKRELMAIVRVDPVNGEAWHLLSQAVDDPAQRADCERRAIAAGYTPNNCIPNAQEKPDIVAAKPMPSAEVAPTTIPFVPSPVPQNRCPRCGGLTPNTIRFCGGCGWDHATPPMPPPAPHIVYVAEAPEKRSWMPYILGCFVVVCMCAWIGGLINDSDLPSNIPDPGSHTAAQSAHYACGEYAKRQVRNPSTAKVGALDAAKFLPGKNPNDWLLSGSIEYDRRGGGRQTSKYVCIVVQDRQFFNVEELEFVDDSP